MQAPGINTERQDELQMVKNLLASEDAWCQNRCKEGDKQCLSQAVCSVCSNETRLFVNEQCIAAGYRGPAELNDKTDYQTVMQFLDDCFLAAGNE